MAQQATHPGEAETGALLGVAVNLNDRVIDVDQHRPLDSRGHRSPGGQSGQQPGGDRVELTHVPEPQAAQERPQRGRRLRTVEDLTHRRVRQQRHVVDAVRSGEHPRDQ
jgi:hypothetical protein